MQLKELVFRGVVLRDFEFKEDWSASLDTSGVFSKCFVSWFASEWGTMAYRVLGVDSVWLSAFPWLFSPASCLESTYFPEFF